MTWSEWIKNYLCKNNEVVSKKEVDSSPVDGKLVFEDRGLQGVEKQHVPWGHREENVLF